MLQCNDSAEMVSTLAAAGCYDAVKEAVWSLANSSEASQRTAAWHLMMDAAAASESPKHIRAMLRVRREALHLYCLTRAHQNLYCLSVCGLVTTTLHPI